MNMKTSTDISVYVKGSDNITTLYQDVSNYVNISTCVIFCHQILQDSLIVTIWQCKNTPYHTEGEGKQSQRLMPFFH